MLIRGLLGLADDRPAAGGGLDVLQPLEADAERLGDQDGRVRQRVTPVLPPLTARRRR
ncbi:MAG: hypothetical protein U0736_28730 [Gemmataceae bacterium]